MKRNNKMQIAIVIALSLILCFLIGVCIWLEIVDRNINNDDLLPEKEDPPKDILPVGTTEKYLENKKETEEETSVSQKGQKETEEGTPPEEGKTENVTEEITETKALEETQEEMTKPAETTSEGAEQENETTTMETETLGNNNGYMTDLG